VDPAFESFRKYADSSAGGASGGGGGGQAPARGADWAIQLANFTGSDRQRKAKALSRKLNRETNLAGLWQTERKGTTTVYLGKFRRAQSPAAQNALRRVRGLKLEGKNLFADANLVALDQQGRQIKDEQNLKAHSGKYSLQVAYYDEKWDGDRRKVAEQQVKAFRKEFDVPAYYYHGPHRSMVTLGLFNEKEAFEMRPDPISPGKTTVRAYSKRVNKLRHRFPHNFANKDQLVQRFQSDKEYQQAQNSALVRIP
jgi:hypothetical protein